MRRWGVQAVHALIGLTNVWSRGLDPLLASFWVCFKWVPCSHCQVLGWHKYGLVWWGLLQRNGPGSNQLEKKEGFVNSYKGNILSCFHWVWTSQLSLKSLSLQSLGKHRSSFISTHWKANARLNVLSMLRTLQPFLQMVFQMMSKPSDRIEPQELPQLRTIREEEHSRKDGSLLRWLHPFFQILIAQEAASLWLQIRAMDLSEGRWGGSGLAWIFYCCLRNPALHTLEVFYKERPREST